ncbi:MAG: hypothetical protein BWX79_02408 [Alphaproteobacteria bacterium ADurb.Bin100]|nr:MAG: hypothetical protein BWX79_02408 [Alphaproteobacteria bacterium ADurb.Bin100]
MATPLWAIICSICLRFSGGIAAICFCSSAMPCSIFPLWLFMVKLCSHRPGFMVCALAPMQARATGATARTRRSFMTESS